MKFVETKKKYGTEFKAIGSIDELNDVNRWVKQNDINHLFTPARQQNINRNVDYYYIRNEISIMAFKLRWV